MKMQRITKLNQDVESEVRDLEVRSPQSFKEVKRHKSEVEIENENSVVD